MRRAGRVVAEALARIEAELRPGVSAARLDEIAEQHMRANGAIPSFKGYLGGARYGDGPAAYPATICLSIDNEVVHGIPGDRTIGSGQLVSVDVHRERHARGPAFLPNGPVFDGHALPRQL